MKLAANIDSLWGELPYFDRFEAAAAAGFQAVSVPLPYEASANETKRAALRAALPVIQISAPPPNYTGGQRGFAAVPGLEGRFRYDLKRALRYCAVLRVPLLHIMAGCAEGTAARDTLLSNLKTAVTSLPKGVTLTLQPQAQPGAYLNNFERAADIIDAVGSDRLGLQFHAVHAEAICNDATSAFQRLAPIIKHVQIGNAPNTARVLETLQDAGYDGWVAADYISQGPTEETLGWMPMVAA